MNDKENTKLRFEEILKPGSKFDLMEKFLVERRPYLVGKDGYLTLAIFPDDFFDQNLSRFCESLIDNIIYYHLGLSLEKDEYELYDKAYEILDSTRPRDVLLNPNYNIDPNNGLDEVIRYSLKKDLPEELSSEKIVALFPKDFFKRIKNWVIIMFLEDNFLKKFYSHRQKFTSASIDKLIEALGICLMGTGHPTLSWTVENTISHFNPIISWTEKVCLHYLYFHGLSPSRSIFCIDPTIYISPKELLNDTSDFNPEDEAEIEFNDYRFEKKFYFEIIPNLLKERLVPKDIYSKELLFKVKKYIIEYTDNLPKYANTLINLFLYFVYYGFMEGRIPGIKDGGYSVELLEQELDEFFNFKPKD